MESNIFGGGNKNFLYTPMSEDEREVLQRLIESDDLEIVVKDWGIVTKFESIKFGDLRLQIIFKVFFSSPDIHIPINLFHLCLRTRSGVVLYEETQPFDQTIMVGSGVQIDLCWDIAIRMMDPMLVKAIKPGSIGLTTREGNRRLDHGTGKALSSLRENEELAKKIRIDKVKSLING